MRSYNLAPPPSLDSPLSLFLSISVCRRSRLLSGEGGGGGRGTIRTQESLVLMIQYPLFVIIEIQRATSLPGTISIPVPTSFWVGGSVVDPYSFFPDPDPDPEFDVGDQYGSGSKSNTDPGLK